jgi:hypothetical protein
LRHAVDHVEQDDLAEFPDAGKMGKRAADLARADQRYAITRHENPLRWMTAREVLRPEPQREIWLNAIGPTRKPQGAIVESG